MDGKNIVIGCLAVLLIAAFVLGGVIIRQDSKQKAQLLDEVTGFIVQASHRSALDYFFEAKPILHSFDDSLNASGIRVLATPYPLLVAEESEVGVTFLGVVELQVYNPFSQDISLEDSSIVVDGPIVFPQEKFLISQRDIAGGKQADYQGVLILGGVQRSFLDRYFLNQASINGKLVSSFMPVTENVSLQLVFTTVEGTAYEVDFQLPVVLIPEEYKNILKKYPEISVEEAFQTMESKFAIAIRDDWKYRFDSSSLAEN